jgi:hypothetical protein
MTPAGYRDHRIALAAQLKSQGATYGPGTDKP